MAVRCAEVAARCGTYIRVACDRRRDSRAVGRAELQRIRRLWVERAKSLCTVHESCSRRALRRKGQRLSRRTEHLPDTGRVQGRRHYARKRRSIHRARARNRARASCRDTFCCDKITLHLLYQRRLLYASCGGRIRTARFHTTTCCGETRMDSNNYCRIRRRSRVPPEAAVAARNSHHSARCILRAHEHYCGLRYQSPLPAPGPGEYFCSRRLLRELSFLTIH